MVTPKQDRPPRATVAPPGPFAVLDAEHRRTLELLGRLESLLPAPDPAREIAGEPSLARACAAEVHEFFSQHARRHHADEERLVFPALLAAGDPVLVEQVRRLQQDHGWIEEDWVELAPQVEALARGYSWSDPVLLSSALPVFAALYREHIALEESLIYPEAKRRQAIADAAVADRTGARR